MTLRELANVSFDRKVNAKIQIIYFLVNASPPEPLDEATSNFAGAYVTLCRGYWAMFRAGAYRVLGNVSFGLDLKVKRQIMHFLVNVSHHKPLDVATSNFAGA